jgi:hypothetical protein
LAMSGCVAGAGHRSSLPQWCGHRQPSRQPEGRARQHRSDGRARQSSGPRIMAFPVRTFPSSSPTPLLKTTQSPLSCARDGNQRTSHSRPWGPRSSASISAGSCSRRSHSAGSIRTRCMGTARAVAAALMRRDQYIRAEQRGCAHSMMLLSQQMRIVIGSHRSNKSDRLAFGRRLDLFQGAAIKT